MQSVVDPIIEAHRQTLDLNSARDFLDVMLIELESCQDPRSPFDPRIGLATIKNSLLDLFLAGMETTSSSLMHIFLQILHHPEVQDKVHHELDTVRGFTSHKEFLLLCLFLGFFRVKGFSTQVHNFAESVNTQNWHLSRWLEGTVSQVFLTERASLTSMLSCLRASVKLASLL